MTDHVPDIKNMMADREGAVARMMHALVHIELYDDLEEDARAVAAGINLLVKLRAMIESYRDEHPEFCAFAAEWMALFDSAEESE